MKFDILTISPPQISKYGYFLDTHTHTHTHTHALSLSLYIEVLI
jgi:hypothetical protein